jgi:hypothetical protein
MCKTSKYPRITPIQAVFARALGSWYAKAFYVWVFPNLSQEKTLVNENNMEANASATVASNAHAKPQPLTINDAKVQTNYANFCSITDTPEEVMIDFGLDPQPFTNSAKTVSMSQRIIMTPYTAKRMAMLLQMTLQRHEATFGTLETDVSKRVRQNPPK